MENLIVGNHHTIAEIYKAFSTSPPHTSIFNGPSVGKLTVAVNLVKSLSCANYSSPFSCCDRCYSCTLFDGDIGYNFHPNCFIFDEAVTISQLRNIVQTGSQSNINGNNRYIILDNFDKVSERLSNVLLKILEEPPASLFFILITKRPVLSTILSRAQIFSFCNLTSAELDTFLATTTFDSDSKRILRYSNIAFIKKLHEYDFFFALIKIRAALQNKSLDDLINIFSEQKENFYIFLEGLSYYAKERMIASLKPEHKFRWSHILSDLLYAETACVSRTFNQGYILQTLALKWYRLLCNFNSSELSFDKLQEYKLEKWLVE